MAQPTTATDLPQSIFDSQRYLTEHWGDVVMLFTNHLPVILALITITAAITWVVAIRYSKKKVGDLEERIRLRDDDIVKLTRAQKELTEQLQSANAKLNEYAREYAFGFHPTIEQVVNGLFALDRIMRRVPIKIVATSEARPFAEQLAIALTRIRYGVLPHAEQVLGIVPARTTHDKIIVRYEEKATNPLHKGLCEEMHVALKHFLAHELRPFPQDGDRDYFQIELLGEP
jgi:hypothetical protein